MANSELSQQQIDQISRIGIKKLIGKYSQSQGKDQQSLTMLLEQLAKRRCTLPCRKTAHPPRCSIL